MPPYVTDAPDVRIHAEPKGPPIYLMLVDGEWTTIHRNRPVTVDDWISEIARLDTEEDLAERERRKAEKTASSLRMNANRWRSTRKTIPEKLGSVRETVQEVLIEDRRRFKFRYFLGTGGAWSGPESLWQWSGEEWRCLFCGHLPRLPGDTACLNPDCCRTGLDHIIGTPTPMELERLARMGPSEAAHATKYVGNEGLKGGVG